MSLLDPQVPATGGVPDHPDQPTSPLKKVLPYTTVLLLLAAGYVAYTFYARHAADMEAQRQTQEKQEEATKKAAAAVFGDGEVQFSTFSIDTRSLQRGQSARLCYGVVNAVSVKIDPPIETLKPTYRHCLDISPNETTTYTITASDGKGHSKTQSLVLPVH